MTRLTDPEKLLLRKCGQEIQTLSAFTPEKNIFNRFVQGNNVSLFLPAETPFEAWQTGEVFHEGWDDFAPWMSDGYATVGANHGSPFTLKISMLRHWFFEKDMGKILTDETGKKFVLIGILSPSEFLIHSVPDYSSEPFFTKEVKGGLYADGIKLDTAAITPIQLPSLPGVQLLPHYRFNAVELLADGQQVPEDTVIECSSARLHWDIDLCLPDALLEYIQKHPGKFVSQVSPEIQSTIHLDMVITFQAGCAYTVVCDGVFMRDVDTLLKFGLLQHYGTTGFDRHEKLIPKLKPFEFAYCTKEPEMIDLNRPYLLQGKPCSSRYFLKRDCLDPADPPRDYLDLFGRNGKRELGVAIGYSATRGITAKNSPDRGDFLLTLPYTGKIYPYAFYKEKVKEKDSFHLSAYRQYVDLSRTQAAASYGHFEEDGFIFRSFWHTSAEETFSFPKALAGKSFEIIEMSGDITLPPNGKIASDSTLNVTVHASGSLTLRISC